MDLRVRSEERISLALATVSVAGRQLEHTGAYRRTHTGVGSRRAGDLLATFAPLTSHRFMK